MKLVKNVVPEAVSKAVRTVQCTVIKFHLHERIDFKIVKVNCQVRTLNNVEDEGIIFRFQTRYFVKSNLQRASRSVPSSLNLYKFKPWRIYLNFILF